MPPSADELILQMQHLEAQARATADARALQAGVGRLKGAAQKLAWSCQKDITALEAVESQGEARLEALRVDGVTPEEAPEYLAVKSRVDDARKRLVRLRAQLSYALDQMLEVERREYEAFHAEVRAEAHGQLADEPGGDGSK